MTNPLSPAEEYSTHYEEGFSSTAIIDAPDIDESSEPSWGGTCCEKCSAPMRSDVVTICRQCGWYASLSQFVDVDQDFEVYSDDNEPTSADPQVSHAEVWLNLLPRWAWVIIATIVAIVVESAIVRLVTPTGSSFRTIWSLAQLVIGLLAFAGCHVFNFLVAAASDAEVGALDIFLKPLKLWFRAFAKLPVRLWVTDAAAAGLTAALMSVLIIGGLPYERLWDWGFQPPPKQNLLGAVAKQIQKVEGNGSNSLEDAVSDFAGSQDLDDVDKLPTPPPKPRQRTDCVILGYRVDGKGRMGAIVLGTAYGQKLVYAGSVLPQKSAAELDELRQKLDAVKTKQPYLQLNFNAVWVRPQYSCRVSFEAQESNGRLLKPRWEQMIGELGL